MSLKSSRKTDTNTTELILFIDPKTFGDAVEKEYQRQKENIEIKGFRKGKVSRAIAESELGKDIFYEGALNSLLGSELDAAVKETGLVLVDRPNVDVISIDKAKGVELRAVCVTRPEISIHDYKGIKAPKRVREITEEDIEQQIYMLRRKNAHMLSVKDRAAQLDDEVIIDFEGFFGEAAFDGGKGEDYPLRLGSGQFIPGFEDQIIGHQTGEEFDVNVPFPEDYHVPDYAGKEAVFKCKLKDIRIEDLPEMNDDLVKDYTEFKTVAEYLDHQKAKLEEAVKAQAEEEFESSVMNALVEKVTDEIPECMYEQRIDALINAFESQLRNQGMNRDLYFQYTGMNEDILRASYKNRAVSEVKLRLALEKIAELEKLEVSEEELNAGLAEIAAANQIDLETAKHCIPIDDYRNDLVARKAMDFVMKNASEDNTVL